MSNKPLISIIVPVYNVEKYLEKCVHSIVKQSYENLEIILVDDGSTDACGALCDQLALQDHRIQVIHKPNGGLSDARNAGLDRMTGKYVTFIDSDDWVSKDYVTSLYNLLVTKNCQIAIGKYIETDGTEAHFPVEKKTVIKWFNNRDAVKMLLYQKEFTTSACGKLYDIGLWKDIRFPVGKLYEDVITIYNIFAKAESAAVSNHIIYYYLRRSGSIVRNQFSIRKMDYVYNVKEVVNKVKDKYPFLVNASLSRLLWAEMHVLIHMDDYRKYEKEYNLLWRDIKKIRKIVIFDLDSRLSNKLLAILSYGGQRIIKSVYLLSGKLK